MFNGQDASADFVLDVRHSPSQIPVIGDGYMDMFIFGELLY